MMDPVINLTNVLVSEFEKIDNRLDQMIENVDDLMARDLPIRRTYWDSSQTVESVPIGRSLIARYPDNFMIDEDSYDDIYAEDYLDQYSDRLERV